MIRIFCDKCGEEVGSSNDNHILVRTDHNSELKWWGNLDLCNKCKKRFEADMEGFLNEYNYNPY